MIKRIKVGMASCGIAAGATEVRDMLEELGSEHEIVEVGCIGHCYAEPLIEVETEDESLFFGNVEPTRASIQSVLDLEESARFQPHAARQALEALHVTTLAGRIDPISMDEYREHRGYEGLEKALAQDPARVVEEVDQSGLRGRGGGGFPTGRKWRMLAQKTSPRKVLICNADEGDPGAFMDRSLMESLPHQVLEGMLIGAHATGATELYIYCRAEYPLALRNLRTAVEKIENAGLNRIGGRTLEISIKEGAGAFVCGEETALIHSLEGKRGTPRYRPPYPTDEGYKGYPSAINNVETFANIPLILRSGADQYAQIGVQGSTGTKLFAMAGDLQYAGLVEVPMGLSIREVIHGIGGAPEGSVKAIQIGGPSGGCIPAEHFDAPIDYDSLGELGAIMGSGGLIAIGQQRCMVKTARYFLDFTTRESCGKCTFCRVGTKRMLESLDGIVGGKGSEEDLDRLEDLGGKIINGSLCGLGQTAPGPVLTTLRYFRDEYLAHVRDGCCPSLECDALVDVTIDLEACIECGACIRVCPVSAISEDFVVDNDVCTRCNSCIEICPAEAISRETGGND